MVVVGRGRAIILKRNEYLTSNAASKALTDSMK
jgi:hypothetical protein